MTHILKLLKNRTTEYTPFELVLKKEGERAVDQMEFLVRKTDVFAPSDRVEVMYDLVPTEGLSAVYTFQGGVKDESTNQNHGTATSVTFADEFQYFGKEAVFNGTSSFVTVNDDNDLDLSGKFDILVWAKWSSTTEQFILSKRSSGTNGFSLSVNASSAGDVKFQIGSNTVTSSSAGFNDGLKHLIRIVRNSSNVVTMYVDDASKGTVTSSYDPTDTNNLLIGKDYGGSFFAGSLLRLRVYKGENLSDLSANLIYTKINPRTVLKFGGYVTKIDSDLTGKKVICQSYGKIFAEKDVRGEAYSGQTVEHIVEDLITSNTSFTFNDRDVPTGITVDSFTADGKLLDIITDFASFTNRVFYTTPAEEFFFEPVSFNDTGVVFTHGQDAALISVSAEDDKKLCNSVTLIGQVEKYDTTESFSGNNNNKIFTLTNTAVSVKVSVGGTEKEPDGVDYELDTLQKQITFNTAPASGTNNVVVDYQYERPLVIKGERPSSIAEYGIHSKRFNLDWISNRSDGVRFVQSYLGKFSEIKQNIQIEFGEPVLYLQENDVINAVNSFLGINSGYVIKSLEWTYPQLNTKLSIGEYRFDYFEDDKEIVRKLHDYESAITKQKEIEDYESPEEVLTIGDTVIMITYDTFGETLNITDGTTIIDKNANNYGSGTYGSQYPSHNTGSVYVSG
jgi:hypothetical protein